MVLTHACCLLVSPGTQLPDAVLGYCGQYYSTRRAADNSVYTEYWYSATAGEISCKLPGRTSAAVPSPHQFPRQVALAHALPLCLTSLFLTSHTLTRTQQPPSLCEFLARDRRRFLSFLDLLPAPAPLQQQQHISCRILGSASSLGLWGASCPSPPSSTRTATPGVAHLGPPSALVLYPTSLRIVASSPATTGASSSTRLLPGRICATSRERLDS